MSKSRGNVVNPDHVVEQYGADSLRYEMFVGPLKKAATNGVGVLFYQKHLFFLAIIQTFMRTKIHRF